MRITKQQIKQLIKEELQKVLQEQVVPPGRDPIAALERAAYANWADFNPRAVEAILNLDKRLDVIEAWRFQLPWELSIMPDPSPVRPTVGAKRKP
jgi:hypothetical protein